MLTHLLLILFILLLYVFVHSFKRGSKKSKEKIFLFISFLLLFVLVATREMTMGNDTQTYLQVFKKCSMMGFDALNLKYETGYLVFNVLLSYISARPRFFMIIMSLIFNAGVFYFIKDNSKNYLLSVIMYICMLFYYNSMTMMRQFLALVIVLFSYSALKKGKNIRFFLLVILASTIHSSALIALLLFPCYKMSHTKKKITLIFLVSLIAMLSLDKIIPFIADFLGKNDLYTNRIGSESLSNVLHFLVFLIIYLFSLYEVKRNKANKVEKENFYLNVLFLAAMINMISINMNILSRAALYFNVFAIVIVPTLINDYIKNKNNVKIVNIALVSILLIYSSAIISWKPEWNSAYNYKSCLFREESYICE